MSYVTLDNGLSLFCYACKEDLPKLSEYAKTCTTTYSISFKEKGYQRQGKGINIYTNKKI